MWGDVVPDLCLRSMLHILFNYFNFFLLNNVI